MNSYNQSEKYQAPIKFSQNFFKNEKAANEVVNLAKFSKNDTVLEIGPGLGILTEKLLKRAGKVVAVEKDREYFRTLRAKFSKEQNLVLINQDFLDADLTLLGSYKVFSNIPFSISSEIINKLAFESNAPEEAYLFVQKEVAEKLIGIELESMTSLLMKPQFQMEIVYNFSSKDFDPEPRIKVVLIKIVKKKRSQLLSIFPADWKLNEKKLYAEYREFVAYLFNQWKPDVGKSLKKLFSNLQLKFVGYNNQIDLSVKPSELTYDEVLILFREFKKLVPPHKQRLTYGWQEKIINVRTEMRKSLYEEGDNGRYRDKVRKFRRTQDDRRKGF